MIAVIFHIKYHNKIKKFKFEMTQKKYNEIIDEIKSGQYDVIKVGQIVFLKENLILIEEII